MLFAWTFPPSRARDVREIVLGLALSCLGWPLAFVATHAAEPDLAGRKEYWDAIFFEDQKVGYAHTVYEPVIQDEQHLVRITAESELTIQRFAETTQQRLRYSSLETPGGEVLRFDSSMASGDPKVGGLSMDASGEVHGEEVQLQMKTLGKTQAAKIPWNKRWGGFFSMEQTLERRPLQPGEKRTLRALVPGFNQTADVEYSAAALETIDTLDGRRELLRVACKIILNQNVLEQTVWTDRQGQTIKTVMPALKQVSYRTTKERATAKSTGKFDLGEKSIVKTDRVFERPHRTRRVVYRATVTSGDPQTLFARGATQSVKPGESRSAEIRVRALRPADELGSEFPPDVPPTPDDLASNGLIQSDDDRIVELSREVATDKKEPWEIAVALEQHVHAIIHSKNFSQALSSAAEVARSREGDCTEHAVLLAALCRARGIPSRVAIGLVYFPPLGGFAYHMWTEAWVRDRWIPLDATLGQGGIGAAHLAVSRSNLKGVDPLSQFLPVLQLIGNLKLEVVSVE